MLVRFVTVLAAFTCLLTGGCGSLPDPHVRVTFPQNGTVISLSEGTRPYYWQWSPGYITFALDSIPQSNDSSCPYPSVIIEPRDNGESYVGTPTAPLPPDLCSAGVPSPQQSWTWQPQALGLHRLGAHIIVITNTGASREYDSDSVTVCIIGDPLHPPQKVPMGMTSADCNPAVPPTFTPVTPIPIHRNPNQNGGSGCSQYHSQSSCNLAGCSWNPQNSSCNVNP